MRRNVILCLLSAGLGAAAVIGMTDPPRVDRPAHAQGVAPAAPEPPGPNPRFLPTRPVRPLQPGLPPSNDELTAEEWVHCSVYDRVNRSVVNITTRGAQTLSFPWVEVPSEGEGSGTVIDRQGHVLTNFHVIDDAQRIRVTLFDGNSYDAEVLGVDPPTDVAVLQIDAPVETLFPVDFGDSSRLRVGQRVYAIGNPFGLERTLSTGIVSSLNRSLPSRTPHRSIKSVIQIDASINPGNSGGPLLDTRARMIGMNTAIASKTGESAGVGFAIPSNTITRVVAELIRNGRVIRPDIGIIRVYQTEKGLLIARMRDGGPAEQAGLRGPRLARKLYRRGPVVYETQTIDRAAADLIVAVDGKPVRTVDDFLTVIDSKRPGDQINVTVIREGRKLDVAVRLAADDA